METKDRKHFAQLDENNLVMRVGVFNANNALDENGDYQESLAITWYKTTFGSNTNWKETSKKSLFRGKGATKGDTYNSSLDVFLSPQPYASWTLDSTIKNWKAPITKPTLTEEQITQGKDYVWNESAYQANNLTGWDLMDNPY
tara:strand:- start:671 stop:1099 length:429 start_codon:yes stop_codon:yes gene_type:complete